MYAHERTTPIKNCIFRSHQQNHSATHCSKKLNSRQDFKLHQNKRGFINSSKSVSRAPACSSGACVFPRKFCLAVIFYINQPYGHIIFGRRSLDIEATRLFNLFPVIETYIENAIGLQLAKGMIQSTTDILQDWFVKHRYRGWRSTFHSHNGVDSTW